MSGHAAEDRAESLGGPPGRGHARHDPVLLGGGVAGVHQDVAVHREVPRGRHHGHGRGRGPHGAPARLARRHARGPPEEDHEQCAEHARADPRQWPLRLPRVT